MNTRRIEPVSRCQKQYRRTVHGLGLLVKLCRNASHGRGLRRQGPGQPSQYFAEPPPHLEMQEPGNRFPARKERAAIAGSGLAALWSSTAALRDEGRNSSPVRTGRSRPMETAVNAKLGSQVWYRTD